MPTLFALLLVMVAYGYFKGDMAGAMHFMFDFDLSAINGKVILVAVGQAFFSIGVAMGLMMGFGAYLPRDISIARSAVIIVSMDTVVAIIAGLAIFPIVFANGLDPAEGPGLIFVSLPIAFGSVTGGLIFGTLFFILLFFAALTSVIGVLEPFIAWWQERFRLERWQAALLGLFLDIRTGNGNDIFVQPVVTVAATQFDRTFRRFRVFRNTGLPYSKYHDAIVRAVAGCFCRLDDQTGRHP